MEWTKQHQVAKQESGFQMTKLSSDAILKAVKNGIQDGKYHERITIIGILESLLKQFPNALVSETIPTFIEYLKEIPAPQSVIDMQKTQIKLGLDNEEFGQYLKDEIKRMTND